MKYSILAMSAFIIIFQSGCMAKDKTKSIVSERWDSVTSPLSFPETDDDKYKVPWLLNRKSFGIAFSGGGARSASATLGQLRALDEMGWLSEAKYISAISGGAWASVPYTYYQGSKDNDFLGSYIPPANLQARDFSSVNKGSLAKSIAKSAVLTKAMGGWFSFKKDETFSATIGGVFLKRTGLNDKRKFFSFHTEALNQTLLNNSTNGFGAEDFYTVKKGRPYLLVGGTLISKDVNNSSSYYPLEITGIYTGVRGKHEVDTNTGNKRTIGGGYIQSFAYDTDTPTPISSDDNKVVAPLSSKRRRFTLNDVVGISGSAPQHTLRTLKIRNLGFPELNHWPVDLSSGSKEYAHGDGGHLDNLGLMPLLVRQVKNILVFANSYKPLDKSETLDIKSYFMPVDEKGLFPGYQKNVVFKKSEYEQLRNGLKPKDGKYPFLYCNKYSVKKNEHYGIYPYEANICWAYLDRNENWIDMVEKSKVGKRISNRLRNKGASFERFPNYKTFLENPPYLINLSNNQVNALSHYTSWQLCMNQKAIAEALNGDGLKLKTNILNCN